MNLTKRSVRFAIGDRVRIANLTGKGILHVGLTGIITSEASIKRTLTDNTQGWLVRIDKPLAILSIFPAPTTVLLYADELEYEDNRDDATVGEMIAWNLDYVRTDENGPLTCKSDSEWFPLASNYRKGDPYAYLKCPDCDMEDWLQVTPERITSIGYNCVRPYREIDAEFYAND